MRKIESAFNILKRRPYVATLPIHLQVEITNACNLQCTTCHRDVLYPKPRNMTLDIFKNIIDDVKPIKVNCSGLGEPFLNPEIFEMVRYAKSSGATVNCATNFTRVTHKIDEIIQSGIDQLKISIDASTRETYKKIRGKNYFEEILKNIHLINLRKRYFKTRHPEIRFNFALQSYNVDELLSTIELANSLDVEGIYIQYLEYIDRECRKKNLVADLTSPQIHALLQKAQRLANKLKIKNNIRIWLRDFEIYWNKMQPSEFFVPNTKKCYFPWFSSWIDADGTVRPCPIIPWKLNVAHMGNLRSKSFAEIWNGSSYINFRKALANNERPTEPCKTCIPQSLFNIFQIGSNLLPK